MAVKTLQGRGAYLGQAEGLALVCPESIQGWSGVDDQTGVIVEKGHSRAGENINGRILVVPYSKGSNGWSCHFHAAMISGYKPAGWIFSKMDSRAGVATVVVGVPAVADFKDEDPCLVIKNGDRIRIDGDTGLVEIIERAEYPH